jgi:hypothetical protein
MEDISKSKVQDLARHLTENVNEILPHVPSDGKLILKKQLADDLTDLFTSPIKACIQSGYFDQEIECFYCRKYFKRVDGYTCNKCGREWCSDRNCRLSDEEALHEETCN